jgi:hypothetical protein
MRVLSFIPNIADGTSLYRGHGVLSEIHKLDPTVRVEFVGEKFRFIDGKGSDIAYFQRPDNKDFFITCMALKRINIPIVVDYDDYLLDVPEHNKYHVIMGLAKNDYKKHVADFLKVADAVIVSTEELKRQFEVHTECTVIRNALDHYSFLPESEQSFEKRVLWRGSATHEMDLLEHKDSIISLIQDNADFEFIFMGDDKIKWLDALKLNNVVFKKALDPYSYFIELKKMRPSLVIVPLQDSLFNRCKSDVAKLEANYCGAICVHPDWEEWNWGVNIQSEYFLNRANYMLSLIRFGSEQAKTIFNHEREYLENNRLLKDANMKRLEVFRSLQS